jgi:hypothetical protein
MLSQNHLVKTTPNPYMPEAQKQARILQLLLMQTRFDKKLAPRN